MIRHLNRDLEALAWQQLDMELGPVANVERIADIQLQQHDPGR